MVPVGQDLQSTAVDNGGNLGALGVGKQKKLMPKIFWMHSRAQECTAIESGRQWKRRNRMEIIVVVRQ
jgi:hypothetical protein